MTQTLDAAASTTTVAKLYRISGWSAIIAAIGYLTQPIIVFIIDPASSAPFDENDPSAWYPDPANALTTWYLGSEQFLQFALIGIAALSVVLATGILIRSRLSATGSFGVWPQLSFIAGIISAAGWLMVAGASLASHSLPAFSLTDFTGVDLQVQKIGLQAGGISIIGTLMGVMLLPTAIWLLGLATSGRRAGVIPTGIAIVAGASAVIFIGNLVFLNLTNHVPQSALLLIVVWLVLGIFFLVRSRSSRKAEL